MTELSLSNNNLAGIIPSDLFDIETLIKVDFTSNSNLGIEEECLKADLCMAPEVSCSVGSNIDFCIQSPVTSALDCPKLADRATCNKFGQGYCRFESGGYGCVEKNFCGFYTKNPLFKTRWKTLPKRLELLGLQPGAPGCLGGNNKKYCKWESKQCSRK